MEPIRTSFDRHEGARISTGRRDTGLAPRGRGRWRSARLLAAALLVSAATMAGLPAGASARGLLTGLMSVPESSPLAFEQAAATGVQFVRVTILWNHIAPSVEPDAWEPADPADPHYKWGATDVAVTEAVHAGLTPVILIYGAPQWAQGCDMPGPQEIAECDTDPAALRAFATAAARRYSGNFAGLPRVHYWQGLNEPNLSIYFTPQFRHGRIVSPARYRRLINVFYAAVKGVKRSNLVLAAGLGPIAIPHLTVGPMRFARMLLCMTGRAHPHPTRGNCEGGVHFDIFDIHPYTTGGPNHKGKVDDVEMGDLGKLTELLSAADEAGRIKGKFRHTPLWITEFSWDSKPPDPGGLPMRILSRWTAEALFRAWSAGIDHFFWLYLTDPLPTPERPFSETVEAGLYFRGATLAEDRPKQVFYAFRFPFVAYSHPRGLFVWGRTPTSEPGAVTIQVRKGGAWHGVGRVRAGAGGVFSARIRTGYGRGRHGSVRARYRGTDAVPFSLHPVKSFYQPPFG